MPPKKAAAPALDSVFILTYSHLDSISKQYNTSEILQVHSTLDSANAAAEGLTDDLTDAFKDPVTNEGKNSAGGYKYHCHAGDDKNDGFELEVAKYGVTSGGGAAKKAAKEQVTKAPAKSKRKAATPEPEVDDEQDEDEEMADEDEEAEAPPPKSKRAAATKKADAPAAGTSKAKKEKDDPRKHIPDGKPDSLAGLKVLFTGTFNIDRKTSEATAVKYGARIITKLEDTDYIILGAKAGPKKLEVIAEHGLETIDEDQFYEMLKTGVPEEKRQKMAAKGTAEPAKKKQKK